MRFRNTFTNQALDVRLLLVLILTVFLLSACTSSPPSRYSLSQDQAPEGDFDASNVPEPTPKWEPLSRQGNKSPYVVLGQSYMVMPSAQGYVEEGISSWYGLKFHGELTSNGEVYNMYEMTAAHKTLPLPTYLKVTNIENGKTITVRVNDRGPFHEDRIIDLSYAAAIKLGFQKQGTARVRLEAVNVEPPASYKKPDGSLKQDKLAPFIQVAASSNEKQAQAMAERVRSVLDNADVFVAKAPDRASPLYRVRIGPFDTEAQARQTLKVVKEKELGQPILITRSIKAKGA